MLPAPLLSRSPYEPRDETIGEAMAEVDIHNNKRRLEALLDNIRASDTISQSNKDALLGYYRSLLFKGLSVARIEKVLYSLYRLAFIFNSNFVDATRQDIERVVEDIDKRDWADRYKGEFKICLRLFFRWLRHTEQYPPEVDWFKVREKNSHRLPEEILTDQEVRRLADAAESPRDRALFQILTPYRGYYYGTESMNISVQKKFRFGLLKSELKGFVPFDKVIQVHNRTIYKRKGQTYLFNGQLGYLQTIWGQGGGAYVKFPDLDEDVAFTDGGRYPIVENLELGYAISIHKAQGSDFEVVFLILPKENKSLLSRELVYTALTRSKKKVVLFLQEDIEPFLEAMRPSNSSIVGRNTSIFIFRFTSAKYMVTDLIHHTANGEAVRSKSEVIVADQLKSHGVSYEYERLLWSKDGNSFRIPDFTIFYEGEEFFWKHLGMTHDPEYMEKWENKKKWYERNGFADKLIVSQEDPSGLDSRKIVELIQTRFQAL